MPVLLPADGTLTLLDSSILFEGVDGSFKIFVGFIFILLDSPITKKARDRLRETKLVESESNQKTHGQGEASCSEAIQSILFFLASTETILIVTESIRTATSSERFKA